jgi:hypothetical protein
VKFHHILNTFLFKEHSRIRTKINPGWGNPSVYLNGVPGVTPRSIHDYLITYYKNNNTVVTIDALIEYYILMQSKKMKRDKKIFETNEKNLYKNMLHVLLQTYLYEPANYSVVPPLVAPVEISTLIMNNQHRFTRIILDLIVKIIILL